LQRKFAEAIFGRIPGCQARGLFPSLKNFRLLPWCLT
jgi:hypothetical protein